MIGCLRWLNPAIKIIGWQIVPDCIGWWSINPFNKKLQRSVHQIGWRLASRHEWQGMPENATALDRFVAARRQRFPRVAAALRITPLSVATLGLCLAAPALAFNGRIINLGDAQISTAVTGQVITSSVSAQSVSIAYVDRLEGVNAVTFQANFSYGSGGTSLKADLETSLDQGATWLAICRIAFTTASAEKVATVSGLTPKTTAAALSTPSDDSCTDGVLGDRLRVRITSVGTYAGNTTISTRAAVR